MCNNDFNNYFNELFLFQCYSKNVHSLIAISSCKDLCVMAVKIDPFIPDEEEDSADHMSFANEQYSLLVCNSIATLIDGKLNNHCIHNKAKVVCFINLNIK